MIVAILMSSYDLTSYDIKDEDIAEDINQRKLKAQECYEALQACWERPCVDVTMEME